MSNNNVRNIKTAVSDSVSVATETFSLALTLTAGAIGLAGSVVRNAPSVTKAALELPFSAGEGYMLEANEDMSEEEAHAKAFKLINQPLSVTIGQAGRGAGKLTAQLFDSIDDTGDNNADTKES